MKPKVLITGATGLLGYSLIRLYEKTFDVYATSRSSITSQINCKHKVFNLIQQDYSDLKSFCEPDFVIHCAAMTNVDYCEKHPKDAYAINTESVVKISNAFPKAKLIFISTDAVFDGTVHMKTEECIRNPLNIYGSSKMGAEDFIIKNHSNYLILRVTIVGKNKNDTNQGGFVDWILSSLTSNNEITLFDDVLFTPTSVMQLGVIIKGLIQENISNEIFHIGSSDAISKYGFGQLLAEKFQLNSNLIKKGTLQSFGIQSKRSSDQTLSSQKLYSRLKEESFSIKDVFACI